MENLIQDHKRLLAELGDVYPRRVYEKLRSDHRIIGIIGARGVGKTTYILYYLKTNYKDDYRALYVSADDIYFSTNNLVDLAGRFVKEYDGRLLCIDEIHKYPNWSRELKNIYDKYPRLKIIFSGSSGIDLVKEKYDLSRRAVLRYLPGLSFREYLEIKGKKDLPVMSLKEIVEKSSSAEDAITQIPGVSGLFKEYLRIGYYPLFKEYSNEKDIHEALEGVIDKIIYMDIASYYSLKTSTLSVFKKILYFIHTSSPSQINVHRLAKSLGKDDGDVARYLEMMRETGLLRFLLMDKRGHALIRNTEKIYLNNPNLAQTLENTTGKPGDTGACREVALVSFLEDAGLLPFYSQVGDIKCQKYTFEIGGANKDLSQIKERSDSYLVCDDIVYREPRKIPLYFFGFLY